MSLNNPLANALSTLNNIRNRGANEAVVKPASKVIKSVLDLLKTEKYIDSYEYIDNQKGGLFLVKLKGAINKIGAIRPNYPIAITEIEKFEKRYLPGKDFGRLIISTNKGILTHVEAKKQNTGGILLAYVY